MHGVFVIHYQSMSSTFKTFYFPYGYYLKRLKACKKKVNKISNFIHMYDVLEDLNLLLFGEHSTSMNFLQLFQRWAIFCPGETPNAS